MSVMSTLSGLCNASGRSGGVGVAGMLAAAAVGGFWAGSLADDRTACAAEAGAAAVAGAPHLTPGFDSDEALKRSAVQEAGVKNEGAGDPPAPGQPDVQADQPRAPAGPSEPPAPDGAGAPGGAGNFGLVLKAMLERTDGCLGVELANTASGKAVVMAWFENKAALRRWYDSPMHRRMVQGLGGRPSAEPMRFIEDENTPILVMATITPSEKPEIQGFPMPISQISIELYAPLPGGAHLNGRLAPAGVTVPHMNALGG